MKKFNPLNYDRSNLLTWKFITNLTAIVVTVISLYVIAFTDDFGQKDIYANDAKNEKLKTIESELKNEIIKDKATLDAFKTDTSALERYAREKFFMKKKGETIYIVDED